MHGVQTSFATRHAGQELDLPLVISTGSVYVYGFILNIFGDAGTVSFEDNDGNTYLHIEGDTGQRLTVDENRWLADNGLTVTSSGGSGGNASVIVFFSQDGA